MASPEQRSFGSTAGPTRRLTQKVGLIAATLTVSAPSARAQQPTEPRSEPAAAQETEGKTAPRIQLEYRTAAPLGQCPNEAWLRNAVAERMGRDPFSATGSLRLVVALELAQRIAVTITLVDIDGSERGKRRLESSPSECLELMRTVALTASLMLDPLIRGDAPAEPPPSPLAPRTKIVFLPDMTPPEPAAPRAPAEPGLRLRASIAGVGRIGALPAASAGLRAQLGLRYRWASLDAGLRLDLPAATSDDAGRGATASLLLGEAAPCYHWGMFNACAVLTLGRLRAQGFGVLNADQLNTFYGAAGARSGVEISVSETLRLALGIEILAPFTPTTLNVDTIELWSTPALQGGLSVGFLLQP